MFRVDNTLSAKSFLYQYFCQKEYKTLAPPPTDMLTMQTEDRPKARPMHQLCYSINAFLYIQSNICTLQSNETNSSGRVFVFSPASMPTLLALRKHISNQHFWRQYQQFLLCVGGVCVNLYLTIIIGTLKKIKGIIC